MRKRDLLELHAAGVRDHVGGDGEAAQVGDAPGSDRVRRYQERREHATGLARVEIPDVQREDRVRHREGIVVQDPEAAHAGARLDRDAHVLRGDREQAFELLLEHARSLVDLLDVVGSAASGVGHPGEQGLVEARSETDGGGAHAPGRGRRAQAGELLG